MNFRSLVFLFLLLCISAISYSQDSTIVSGIDVIMKKNYERQNKTYWILTKEPIVKNASGFGIEVSIGMINDSLYRIVCMGSDSLGKWGKEFYVMQGKLEFIYFTNEFYIDSGPKTGFKNWKGYPASECRAYFRDGKLLHEEHQGIKNDLTYQAMLSALPAEYQKIFQWVKKKLPGVTLN